MANYEGRMMKMLFRIVLLVSVVMLVFVGACGERTESSRYYYSPSWTRLGQVVFLGGTENIRKDALGSRLGSAYYESIQTIYAEGTSESAAIYDVTSATPYAMVCAPVGDYVAYMREPRLSTYGKIAIRSLSSEAYTGMTRTEIDFTPRINAFDWSNDALKLVFCTSTEIKTIDIDGSNETLVTAEADLEFVSWQYGSRIAFVRDVSGTKLLSLINSDGSGRLDMGAGASVSYPQVSPTNTNEVYGVFGSSYCKVDVSAATPATTEVLAVFSGSVPRLSPDGTRVIYDKAAETTGIYVLGDVTGSPTETQVK